MDHVQHNDDVVTDDVPLPTALPHTLTEMVTHLQDPKVAIVHQLPFTLPDASFAGVLDSVSVTA